MPGSIGLRTLTFGSKNLLANVVRHFFLTQELAFTVISLNVNPTYMFITRKIINAHNTLTAAAVLRMNYKLKALNFGNRHESDHKVRVLISSLRQALTCLSPYMTNKDVLD